MSRFNLRRAARRAAPQLLIRTIGLHASLIQREVNAAQCVGRFESDALSRLCRGKYERRDRYRNDPGKWTVEPVKPHHCVVAVTAGPFAIREW